MDIWNILEYAAWALSVLFGGLMLYDMVRVDTGDTDLTTPTE